MTSHIGRSWPGSGNPIEAKCPCPKAPCGLVNDSTRDPDCAQHSASKTIRQGHAAEKCPGPGPVPPQPCEVPDDVVAMPNLGLYPHLIAEERRALAYHAEQLANEYRDIRYYRDLTGAQRDEAFKRWMEIARGLHPGRQPAAPCCDMHNVHCEPPSDLCCRRCTEAGHDTFPIRHADGAPCVLPGQPGPPVGPAR